MAALITSSPTALLFTFLLLQGNHVSFAADDCSDQTCGEGGPTIRLPFYISDNPDNRITNNITDHRLFGLTCKNNTSQAMFKFPYSGEFVVDTIDYVNRRVQLRDPDGCLARRLQDPIAISGTYLSFDKYVELKFVTCSKHSMWDSSSPYGKVGCLSDERNNVFMRSGDFEVNPLENAVYGCFDSWTETVPLPWETYGDGFPETFWLSWGQDFDCQIVHRTNGFLKSKLVLIICITAAPWVICFACVLCRKAAVSLDRTPADSTSDLTTITVMGMDMSAIELAFPKTRVGDTLQLPHVEDNTCSICLSEYQTAETLRTITQCNHYFHADCVDEWLKKNATCPLCRNYQAYVPPRLLGFRSIF